MVMVGSTNKRIYKDNSIYSVCKKLISECSFHSTKKLCMGLYYVNIHILLMILMGIILMMSNNIKYLSVLFVIITLDLIVNVVCHDCPLTSLEEKYLKTSNKKERSDKMLQMGIMYKCKHSYENQLDVLINVLIMNFGKIVVLLFFRLYNIQIDPL